MQKYDLLNGTYELLTSIASRKKTKHNSLRQFFIDRNNFLSFSNFDDAVCQSLVLLYSILKIPFSFWFLLLLNFFKIHPKLIISFWLKQKQFWCLSVCKAFSKKKMKCLWIRIDYNEMIMPCFHLRTHLRNRSFVVF